MAGSEPGMTPTGAMVESRLRTDLAALYRIVALCGWDDLLATHISVRLPGPEHHFLINPLGWLFEEITASSLVKVDHDGIVLDERLVEINPAGFTIHSAVHGSRADAMCVIHLHTVAGIAVSSQAQGLLPRYQTAMLLNDRIAYHDYEGVALDLDERARLVRDLGDKPAMILRNHGTLAVGTSVGDAFQTMYFSSVRAPSRSPRPPATQACRFRDRRSRKRFRNRSPASATARTACSGRRCCASWIGSTRVIATRRDSFRRFRCRSTGRSHQSAVFLVASNVGLEAPGDGGKPTTPPSTGIVTPVT